MTWTSQPFIMSTAAARTSGNLSSGRGVNQFDKPPVGESEKQPARGKPPPQAIEGNLELNGRPALDVQDVRRDVYDALLLGVLGQSAQDQRLRGFDPTLIIFRRRLQRGLPERDAGIRNLGICQVDFPRRAGRNPTSRQRHMPPQRAVLEDNDLRQISVEILIGHHRGEIKGHGTWPGLGGLGGSRLLGGLGHPEWQRLQQAGHQNERTKIVPHSDYSGEQTSGRLRFTRLTAGVPRRPSHR